MLPNRLCTDPDCPNRGFLALDANFIFYLIEGTIRSVQQRCPELRTNANRLDRIIDELDINLRIIENCCCVDGVLHISDRMLHDEVLAVDPRSQNLVELSKYNEVERRSILRVLRNHFIEPTIVQENEVNDLRGIFHNPNDRPDDIDATLIVAACHLSIGNRRTLILTSDPDFSKPVRSLMHRGTVILGENELPTESLINMDYFSFIQRLHDCCCLPTDRYKPLAEIFHAALVIRLPKIRRSAVEKRDTQRLLKVWAIHTESILRKGTEA